MPETNQTDDLTQRNGERTRRLRVRPGGCRKSRRCKVKRKPAKPRGRWSVPPKVRYYTPPTLARLWGCKACTVIDRILDGELEAFNIARPGCTRATMAHFARGRRRVQAPAGPPS